MSNSLNLLYCIRHFKRPEYSPYCAKYLTAIIEHDPEQSPEQYLDSLVTVRELVWTDPVSPGKIHARMVILRTKLVTLSELKTLPGVISVAEYSPQW